MRSLDKGQFAVSLGVGLLGIFFLVGSFLLTDAAGYSTVGPAAVPRFVGIGLLIVSGLLFYEVVRGGFRAHDEAGERALGFDWSAFGWISGGLILYGLLIEHAGFIFSSIILFVCTARGFNNRRWVLNAVVAAVLAVAIFAIFNYGLGLNLPKGVLKAIL
jgi:putative tricarboxylic transport membrane protein